MVQIWQIPDYQPLWGRMSVCLVIRCLPEEQMRLEVENVSICANRAEKIWHKAEFQKVLL